MPKVNGKKYPYTDKGVKEAYLAAEKAGKKVTTRPPKTAEKKK